MSLEAMRRDEEKRFFITEVNFRLNQWNDSGEVDYLRKAIAAINAQIKKEEEHE